MIPIQTVKVVVETDGKAIDVADLAEFLYHFRAAYTAALYVDSQSIEVSNDNDAQRLKAILEKEIHGLPWQDISTLAYAELDDLALGVVDIKRENPLEIVFSGVLIALTGAVILSGGKLKAGPISVDLPPLGTGITELRKAFGRAPRTKRRLEP